MNWSNEQLGYIVHMAHREEEYRVLKAIYGEPWHVTEMWVFFALPIVAGIVYGFRSEHEHWLSSVLVVVVIMAIAYPIAALRHTSNLASVKDARVWFLDSVRCCELNGVFDMHTPSKFWSDEVCAAIREVRKAERAYNEAKRQRQATGS
jgi:hypothetical protein